MKTSKVTVSSPVIENNQPAFFENEHGRFWKHNISFENGDTGICNVKNGFNCKFIVGQDGTYDIPSIGVIKYVNPKYDQGIQAMNQPSQPTQQPATHQPTKPIQSNDPVRTSIERQTCIKAAADLHKETGATAQNVIESATMFYNWINEV